MAEKTPLQLALWIEKLERRIEALEQAATITRRQSSPSGILPADARTSPFLLQDIDGAVNG